MEPPGKLDAFAQSETSLSTNGNQLTANRSPLTIGRRKTANAEHSTRASELHQQPLFDVTADCSLTVSERKEELPSRDTPREYRGCGNSCWLLRLRLHFQRTVGRSRRGSRSNDPDAICKLTQKIGRRGALLSVHGRKKSVSGALYILPQNRRIRMCTG